MERESHIDPYGNMPPEPPEGTEDFSLEYDPRAIAAEPLEPNSPTTDLTKPEGAGLSGVFANRETGHLIRIISANDAYVLYASLDGTGRFNMPIKDYNETFAKWWRPATAEDLAGTRKADDPPIPTPANAPDDWRS